MCVQAASASSIPIAASASSPSRRSSMPLIRATGVVDDPWLFVQDEEPLPEAGALIVTLARWQANRDQLLARPTPLGLRFEGDQRGRHRALRYHRARISTVHQ